MKAHTKRHSSSYRGQAHTGWRETRVLPKAPDGLNVLSREGRPVDDVTEGGENRGDPTDQATVESDRTLLLRMRNREWKLAGKIQEALDRIEDGTYGICEECGEEISEKRLMARPVTTLCMDCKTSQEEDELRQGAYLKR